MSKGRQFKGFVLLLLCFFVFGGVKLSYADECDGVTPTYDGPDCDPGTGSACPACGGGGGPCCVSDATLGVYCCVDLTAVPELPSWFGPFFLATVVAGWEYYRVRRRRPAVKSIVKR